MSKTYQANYFTAEQLDSFMQKVQDKTLAGRGLSMDDDGVMHSKASGYWNLLHKYTHTANKELHPEAINLETGEITVTAHGLAGGELVFVAVHEPYHVTTPYDYLPGGLIIGSPTTLRMLTRYLVQRVDDNTFKIADRSTLEALTYTEVATMDLTKFHFEVWEERDVVIGDLPDLTEALMVIKGRVATSYNYIVPTGRIDYVDMQGIAHFDNYSGSASNKGNTLLGYRAGWGAMYATIEMKYVGHGHLLQFKEEDTVCFSSTNKASAFHNRTYAHRTMEGDTFNEIKFYDGGCFINGATVEVYGK